MFALKALELEGEKLAKPGVAKRFS